MHKQTVPPTEGIKYVGSKLKLIPHILDMLKNLPIHTALDAFSGTTRVAQAFAQTGYNTDANDIAEWSEVFGRCYLLADKPQEYYASLIAHLNALPPQRGWFTEHYGGCQEHQKRPFQEHNAMKVDAIREEIDHMSLNSEDRSVLLTSLILAMDKVDSTMGHFSSYLAHWASRSFRTLHLEVPQKFPIHTKNSVSRQDALEAVQKYHDLVYLDPPYGSNNEKMPSSRVRYAAYYHLWKTVVLNDKPSLFGAAQRREDSRDTRVLSPYEDYRTDSDGYHRAMKAIDSLIEKVNARYILLSYSSGGRATKDELADILQHHGNLHSAVEVDYRRNIMSRFTWTNKWNNSSGVHKEYLFLMEK